MLSIVERKFNMMILVSQMLIGVPACPPLYFMVLLAFSTIVIWSVVHISNNSSAWLLLLLIGCLSLQYTEINYNMFRGLPFHQRMALGRFVELLPSAILGFLLWKIRNRRILTVSLGSMAILIIGFLKIIGIDYSCSGFGYSGIQLLLWAFGLSSLALWISDISIHEKIMSCLKSCAGMTAGVYYVHILVGKIIEIPFGRNRGWIEAIVVFSCSLGVVWVIKRSKHFAWLVV